MKIRFTTAIYTHTGGLIRLYIVIWSVLSQFKWLLLFLHHAWRGHGARLSIRTKDPNNHSDTETGTLSISSPRAESARAFTGRRNSHSGRGEDFLSRQPNFFTETAVTPERKVEKWFPRWEINRHAEG